MSDPNTWGTDGPPVLPSDADVTTLQAELSALTVAVDADIEEINTELDTHAAELSDHTDAIAGLLAAYHSEARAPTGADLGVSALWFNTAGDAGRPSVYIRCGTDVVDGDPVARWAGPFCYDQGRTCISSVILDPGNGGIVIAPGGLVGPAFDTAPKALLIVANGSALRAIEALNYRRRAVVAGEGATGFEWWYDAADMEPDGPTHIRPDIILSDDAPGRWRPVSSYTVAVAQNTADAAGAAIGDLAGLATADKSSIVAAINEIIARIAPL